MPHSLLNKLGATTLVVVVASLGFCATALAWWSATGSESGSDTAATVAPVTLSSGVTTTPLYPTGTTTGGVATVVSNPNEFPVRIPSLVLDTTGGTDGFDVDAGHAACGVTSLSFTTQTNGGAGWTIPARAGGIDGTLAIDVTAVALAADAPNACQGATFTVYLRPSGS